MNARVTHVSRICRNVAPLVLSGVLAAVAPAGARAAQTELHDGTLRTLAGRTGYAVLQADSANWSGRLVVWVYDGSARQAPADGDLLDAVNASKSAGSAPDAVVLLRVAPDNLRTEVSDADVQNLLKDFAARFARPRSVVLRNAVAGKELVLLGVRSYENRDISPEPVPVPIECGQPCSRLVWEQKEASCDGTVSISGGWDCLDFSLYFGTEWANCNVPNFNVACPARCVCSETHSTVEETVCASLAAGTRTSGDCKITWTGTMTIKVTSAVTHGTCKPGVGQY